MSKIGKDEIEIIDDFKKVEEKCKKNEEWKEWELRVKRDEIWNLRSGGNKIEWMILKEKKGVRKEVKRVKSRKFEGIDRNLGKGNRKKEIGKIMEGSKMKVENGRKEKLEIEILKRKIEKRRRKVREVEKVKKIERMEEMS